MTDFAWERFRPLEIGDRAELETLLHRMEPKTCELNFFNLFTWTHSYDTLFQIVNGRPYFYFQKTDELLFPGGENQELFPEPEELTDVSDKMLAAGKTGSFHLAPVSYAAVKPGILQEFEDLSVSRDIGEYVHLSEHLTTLSGSKLGKKKNLIHQFQRMHPDYTVVPLDASRIPDCRELDRKWTAAKAEAHARHQDAIGGETDAMERMYAFFAQLDVQGWCLYAEGRLAAFTLYDPLNHDTVIEHYEKSDPEFKGAAQLINQESAKYLCGQFRYINREQDLGFEGLRHAKLSYAPEEIVINRDLVRKHKGGSAS